MKMYSGSCMILFYFSLLGHYRVHLEQLLEFRLELTVVFHVSTNVFETSSEFVLFIDMFQHFDVG